MQSGHISQTLCAIQWSVWCFLVSLRRSRSPVRRRDPQFSTSPDRSRDWPSFDRGGLGDRPADRADRGGGFERMDRNYQDRVADRGFSNRRDGEVGGGDRNYPDNHPDDRGFDRGSRSLDRDNSGILWVQYFLALHRAMCVIVPGKFSCMYSKYMLFGGVMIILCPAHVEPEAIWKSQKRHCRIPVCLTVSHGDVRLFFLSFPPPPPFCMHAFWLLPYPTCHAADPWVLSQS